MESKFIMTTEGMVDSLFASLPQTNKQTKETTTNNNNKSQWVDERRISRIYKNLRAASQKSMSCT